MRSVATDNCLAHILVCTNQRCDSPLPSCAKADADAVHDAFEAWLISHKLRARIWLTRTECLGWCHVDGTTVAIYPQDILYRAVTPRDCSTIIQRHLLPLLPSP